MTKTFDELTIADDFIFCSVMQNTALCKRLLSLVLKHKIGTILTLVRQKHINNYPESKAVRLDLMIKDDKGNIYDIEMQTVNERNLAKRTRYYQCAIDDSAINKGIDYNAFIMFFREPLKTSVFRGFPQIPFAMFFISYRYIKTYEKLVGHLLKIQ